MTNLDAQVSDERSWERARKLIRETGHISATFTTCVRALVGDGKTSSGSRFTLVASQQLDRLLRSPTVVTHLYFAARTYHANELEEMGEYTPRHIAELFTPLELATLLMIIYSHRLLTRKMPQDDWEPLASKLQLYIDLAIPLGETIPAVGSVRALLIGAGRYLGWGVMTKHDPKGIKKYRIATKLKNRHFDLQEELDNWGTTHVHVAAILFQSFGLGISITEGYMGSMFTSRGEKLAPEALRCRVAQLWLDSLIMSGDVPNESLGDDFILSEDKTEPFVQRVQALIANGSEFSWLSRRKTEIGPEHTPSLLFIPPVDKPTASKRRKQKEEAQRDESIDEELGPEDHSGDGVA